MIESSKHTVTDHPWRNRTRTVLSRILRGPSLGTGTLGNANAHGFIITALARSSLAAMMQRVGVASEKVSANPPLHDDLARKCAKCTERERCREWLADPDSAPDAYREFCDNAEQFEKLGADR